jgi:hypothetical protein
MNESIDNPAIEIPPATIIGNAGYLVAHFERTEGGWIAFKIFNLIYSPPERWEIKIGSTLTEPDLETNPEYDCAQGINIAQNVRWIEDFINEISSDDDGNTVADVWKVFIPDTAIIVIPHGTDGKIRTNEIHLLEIVGQAFYHEDWDDDEDEY